MQITLKVITLFIFSLVCFHSAVTYAETERYLDELDLSTSTCGWRVTQPCKSVEGHPITLGGRLFKRGVGTHPPGTICIQLDPVPGSFSAMVGIDDEVGKKGHAEFLIYGDKKLLWRSGFMTGGQEPKECKIDFNGIKLLRLVVDTGNEGYAHDHTDWADAKIITQGKTLHTIRSAPEIKSITGKNLLRSEDENTCEWNALTSQLKQGMKPHVKMQAFHPASTIMDSDRDPLDVVLRRINPLVEYLSHMEKAPNLDSEISELKVLQEKASAVEITNIPARKELFAQATAVRRKIMLKNPLINFKDLVFIKRHFNPNGEKEGNHMCDQFFGFNGRPGGGLFILKNAFTDQPVIQNILENATIHTTPYISSKYSGVKMDSSWAVLSPELSWDGTEILFAATDVKVRRHTYTWTPENTYHIFRVNTDGSKLTQLTEGPTNDFDPCYLPNGRILFISERRGGYGRCHGRPVPSFTLHSMLQDGRDITMLSPHETNEWQPSVDHAGMVIYTRWDYVDRGFNQAHHPWITSPDGCDSRPIHGNYGASSNARPHFEAQVRAIPGSHKIIATAACHHGQSYGSLVLVDPKIPDDDKMGPVRRLTPDQLFPEAECATHRDPANYSSPYPLDEYTFICVYDAFSKSNAGTANNYGIYLVDAFGNRTLLYRDPNISCHDPLPLCPRTVPPTVPHRTLVGLPLAPGEEFRPLNYDDLPKTALVGVINVYDSINKIPQDSQIKELRIVQLLPKTTPIAHNPQIGYGNQKSARKILGTVPVESDGSALFKLPVDVPVYFQALDQNGVAIQSMRSATYVHHGENLVCQGCHEQRHAAVGNLFQRHQTPMAMRRSPSDIKPCMPGSNPFSYPILIQPILEKHCVECHEKEAKNKKTFLLGKGAPNQHFYDSFKNLRPYTFYFNNADWTTPRTEPGLFGSYACPLYKTLTGDHYGVKLSPEELRAFTLWMDNNCDFYGSYEHIPAQRRGEIIQPTLE